MCPPPSSPLSGDDRLMKWVVESSPALSPGRTENSDFAALRRLSPDGEERGCRWARVRESFILRSAQQEETLHRIWYALRRW
ncbi:unnamed protein product [Spirodela intermedia]|uniref:Uncharacterized protein n=1 Tax=Spirodela intermedia TaxID=51605 RepID=A0ABN7EA95_SPIIN|nr:unnamed protein product [Spirodela intermedia]